MPASINSSDIRSNTELSGRSARLLLVAVLGAAALLSGLTAVPAVATPQTSPLTIPATSSGSITVTWTKSGGDGSSQSARIIYRVTVDDCSKQPAQNEEIELNTATVASDRGKWFEIGVTCTTGSAGPAELVILGGSPPLATSASTSGGGSGASTASLEFQLLPSNAANPVQAGINVLSAAPGVNEISIVVFAPAGSGPSSSSSSSSSSSAPDPRAQSVAVVAEQVAAAGVQGAASGVRVRDGEVLPVTTRVSSTVGPRGGVQLDSDGMQVRVASVLGARADSGVIVPSNGVFEASVTGGLVPGSVVEVWINSEPRLVAAAEVPEDGDVTIAIPTGTPLDGGDPIEDGEHTLELRMFTEDGYEIVATGITVGQVAPTRVPAGEGPAPLGGVLPLLAGVLLVAAVAGRRVAVRG